VSAPSPFCSRRVPRAAELAKRYGHRPSALVQATVATDERIDRCLADARRADARLLQERLRIEGTLLQLARTEAELDMLGARVETLRELQAA
jgi:multidrug resistance efflux pump